eukprot:TRINITY_DN15243_c0_g2_i1.p1 TRINITY_DN15243_c0_g2~~TRINITY_DN15243_c0_g2_i1.p1  ORF type:complete len:237 (+),score=82.10 TRINITY_DN15243_c0_g2_i1:68-712(+)
MAAGAGPGRAALEGIITAEESAALIREYAAAAAGELPAGSVDCRRPESPQLPVNRPFPIANAEAGSHYHLCVLNTPAVMEISGRVQDRLQERTGVPWRGQTMNDEYLPMNAYVAGEFIHPHRDIDLGWGPIGTVATVLLHSSFEGGAIWVNSAAEVYEQSKVRGEDAAQRAVQSGLRGGDAFLFINDRFVHGTERVTSGTRYVATFRTPHLCRI